jgi:serine/threonine protein kinase
MPLQDRDTVYALKRFYASERTEIYFEKEVTALRALARVPHPNITLHLASWAQDGRFYILFPCAESNLQSHLLQEPAPELKKEFVLFLLTQLRDLAAAVEHIHNLNLGNSVQKPTNVAHNLGSNLRIGTARKYRHWGFHYDLKLDNILIFQHDKKASPIWRISDFGTAQISEIVLSGSQQPTDTNRVDDSTRDDPEYGGPDFAYQQWSSRPYNIWSLGCIYLQVLLWTFGYGGQHLRDFQVQRLKTSESQSNQSTAFWYRDRRSKLKLKPAVVIKLQDLQSCCQNRGVFDDLVTLTANMLTIVPKERPEASGVRSAINALLIQAENDLKNPNFYKDGHRDREVIAKPATVVRSPSRPESIDLRSVTASPVTPDRADPVGLGLGEHRRSFSEPLREVEPLDSGDHGGYEFVGNHLDNGELSLQRSRSPSISIVNPEGTARLHVDSDFGTLPLMLSYRNIVRNQDI